MHAAMQRGNLDFEVVDAGSGCPPPGPAGGCRPYATPRILRTSSAPSSPTAAATQYSAR